MLDAFIIEKLKEEEKKREELERWQPIPLPMEHSTPELERKEEREKEGAADSLRL